MKLENRLTNLSKSKSQPAGAETLERIVEASQPAGAAWIEIVLLCFYRNGGGGRSPQGLRGLKWISGDIGAQNVDVAARRGCVD